MAKRLSGSARRELIVAVRGRYSTSAPSVKREILREFVAITGYHRKSAIRILNGNGCDSVHNAQRPRLYDDAFRSTLIVLWEASDRVCGKRLRALLPLLVPALERHGHLVLEPSARIKLLAVSAATIDRLLAKPEDYATDGGYDGHRRHCDAASLFARLRIGTPRSLVLWRSISSRTAVIAWWAPLLYFDIDRHREHLD
jgi:hypothetical protein